MATIKFPIEFRSDGGLVVLEEGGTDYYRQLLAFTALTEPGTHPYTPSFGVYDPSFRALDRGAFMMQAARFIPEIVITSVTGVVDQNEGRTALKVAFERR